MIFSQQHPSQLDHIAINDLSRTISWQTLDNQALKLAYFLIEQKKIKAGEHIALLIGNRVEFFEAALAGMLAGVWITPINTHLTANECQYILENSGAKILFYDDDHADRLSQTDACEHININELSRSLLAQNKIPQPLALDRPSGGFMMYTSGTTGRPKGVKRNQANSLGEAFEKTRAGARLIGLQGNGPHLITGPLYHAAPMLFALYDMFLGAPLVIMPKWDNNNFLKLVAEHKVTTTHLVPTMFVRLLNQRAQNQAIPDLSSLQLVLHGAAPIARSVKQQMIDWWGEILVEYWGGSEAGTTTLVNSQDWLKHPGTVGKPLDHFEVFVGDKEGNKIDDKTGQLFCKHQTLEQVFEYHNDPEKTAKSHPQKNIFCIGDIGRVDEQGFVYLSDRESNMIISGGVNIYPAEVEQAMMEHPAICDVAVFGIPNAEWGEEVKALIQLTDGSNDSDELILDIITFLQDNIARFKIPRHLQFIDELPRNPAGKIVIKKLKEQYSD